VAAALRSAKGYVRCLTTLLFAKVLWFWWMILEEWWNDTDRGKLKWLKENVANTALFTTNLAWTDVGSNPGLRGGGQRITPLAMTCFSFVFYLFFFSNGERAWTCLCVGQCQLCALGLNCATWRHCDKYRKVSRVIHNGFNWHYTTQD